MKRRICVAAYVGLLLWLFSISYGYCASTVTFEWNHPTYQAEGVTGFKLFIGNASKTYTITHDAPLNSSVLKVIDADSFQTSVAIPDGKWFAAAIAYDAVGNKSPYSDEIMFEQDTTAPSGVLHFKFISVGRK